ncbi:unnamed protein product [Microthlaspi erraticum]|uniref:Uncharacterized protein n=1 Tax=Microthlaspi erraticum TaxID=1685480 RepID=A0A6D2J8J2_9BRAS|nr:unnamed protein product [Microthlaspi erraticum]
MFGVDRFDDILPPGTGAIMAVGASQPTVVATKDGRIGMKSQMQRKCYMDLVSYRGNEYTLAFTIASNDTPLRVPFRQV